MHVQIYKLYQHLKITILIQTNQIKMANTEKVSKYHELRLQSKEEREEVEVGFQVEETQQQLESAILATRRELAKAKKDKNALLGAYPLNPQAVIDKDIHIESLEDGIKRLNELKNLLF
jgi:hypothetical protein